jgi:putative peptidoglycan lipid II flippase
LTCYAIGLAGFALVKLLAPAFYALGDSRTPMLVSIGAIAVNAATAFTTVRIFGFGHAGLALSVSTVSIFTALMLLGLLRPRIGGVHGWAIGGSLAKILIASAVMGAVCMAVLRMTHSRWMNLLVGVPVGGMVFYLAASLLRVREVGELREMVLRKLGRPMAPTDE